MQVEMKGVLDGSKLNERFRSAGTVEKVFLDESEYQFLSKDGDGLYFMNQEAFEQIELPTDIIGESAQFLSDQRRIAQNCYSSNC